MCCVPWIPGKIGVGTDTPTPKFVWFFGNQTNSLYSFVVPLLTSDGANPKSNHPKRIMLPSTHQCTIHEKPIMTHFPSRQTTACKAELPRFHLIISNLSCKPSSFSLTPSGLTTSIVPIYRVQPGYMVLVRVLMILKNLPVKYDLRQ
jgi:hypothetical protein